MNQSEPAQNSVIEALRNECYALESQYLRHASRQPPYSPELQKLICTTLLRAKIEVEAKLEQYLVQRPWG